MLSLVWPFLGLTLALSHSESSGFLFPMALETALAWKARNENKEEHRSSFFGSELKASRYKAGMASDPCGP